MYDPTDVVGVKSREEVVEGIAQIPRGSEEVGVDVDYLTRHAIVYFTINDGPLEASPLSAFGLACAVMCSMRSPCSIEPTERYGLGKLIIQAIVEPQYLDGLVVRRAYDLLEEMLRNVTETGFITAGSDED